MCSYLFKKYFNPNIIKNFRNNIVIDSKEFTFQYYRQYHSDKNEIKNIWDKICSCADWIQVPVQYLQRKINFSEDISAGMEFLHFITTLDVLSEAVEQMWLCFDVDKPNFNNTHNIFHKQKSDREYFHDIRAFFGMHSVNGHSQTITSNKGKEIKDVRYFSSWVTKFGDNFHTHLYSNNNEAKKEIGDFSININDLVKYASERYLSLEKLENRIISKYKDQEQRINNGIKKIINLNIPSFDKIVKLRKYAKNHYKGHICSDEIEFYKKIHDINLDSFKEKDKSLIQKYVSKLNKVILPGYIGALQGKEDSKKIDFLYPEYDNKMFSNYNYSLAHIVDNPDFISKYTSLHELVKNNILPKYSKNLSNNELKLLIKAKYYSYPNHPNQTKNNKSNDNIVNWLNNLGNPSNNKK